MAVELIRADQVIRGQTVIDEAGNPMVVRSVTKGILRGCVSLNYDKGYSEVRRGTMVQVI